MKIINPLYDQAFKYLMENNKFAKKVLSLILDVEVEEVVLEQQETIVTDKEKLFRMFRMDFKAMIREADGSRKTVLIEVQKSKYSTDIKRFRNYLGSNYMSVVKDVNPVQEPLPENYSGFPIVTIYILGYNLPDLPYMAVSVNREVINSVSKEKLKVKSYFIEHLTHQSHIIQIRRLPEKRRTRLERFLMLFNQEWCTKEGFIIELPEVPAGFSEMVRYLQNPLLDDLFHRQLMMEQEFDIIFSEQETKYLFNVVLLEQQKMEAERQLLITMNQVRGAELQRQEAEQQKDKAEQQRREAEQQKDEAEQQRREAEQQKDEAEQQRREAEQQKDEAEQQKDEAEQQRREAEQQRREAEQQKQEAERQWLAADTIKLDLARKFAMHLLQTGSQVDFVVEQTGLTAKEVNNLVHGNS